MGVSDQAWRRKDRLVQTSPSTEPIYLSQLLHGYGDKAFDCCEETGRNSGRLPLLPKETLPRNYQGKSRESVLRCDTYRLYFDSSSGKAPAVMQIQDR